jgi:hypothetical protein
MDPIDAIPTFEGRQSYVDRLLSAGDKIPQREMQLIKKHKYQLTYILALYEIIEARNHKTNFEYFRKGYIEREGATKEKADLDFKKDISGFCLNFRPYEEFYDPTKIERDERMKKSIMYRDESPPKQMRATESTAANYSAINYPRKSELSPSPMKAPAQENTYKFDYSSMLVKPLFATNSMAEVPTNRESEKENIPEPETTKAQNSKPFANQQQIRDSEFRLRISEFDRLY